MYKFYTDISEETAYRDMNLYYTKLADRFFTPAYCSYDNQVPRWPTCACPKTWPAVWLS